MYKITYVEIDIKIPDYLMKSPRFDNFYSVYFSSVDGKYSAVSSTSDQFEQKDIRD